MKIEFPDKWKYLNIQLPYPFEYFNGIDNYQKAVKDLKEENFSSKLENENIGKFSIKKGEELTKLYLKSQINLLADSFEKPIKVSIEEFDINPL